MAYTQEYVNQLIKEAAAQAGGSLSYADVANAAANLGIPLSQVDAAMSAGAPVSEVVSRVEATGLTIQPNDYSQAYVDQLVKEAAAQAGGTLSYEDAVRAATNLGIPSSMLQNSIASELITAAPTTTTTSAAPTEGVVSDTALKNWIDSNAGATTGQLYTAALNQGIGLDQFQRVTGLSTQDLLKEQILSTSDSSQWSGEGWGSAEKNAADMAKILSGIGITDIRQFGQFEQKGTRQETVIPEYSDYGYDSPKPTGRYYIPQYTLMGDGDVMTGKTYVDPSSVYGGQIGSGDSSYSAYFTDVPTTQLVYGNKETGQVVPNTYSERQTGNAWGGTFAGDGNTGYRVQFDAQGTPIFYTTYASSSDLGDLAPWLFAGSLAVAPWLSTEIGALTNLTGAGLSAATGATLGGATSLLTGGDLGDIAKGALIGGGTGYLFGLLRSGVTDIDLLQQAADADMAAGMLPEYGTNAAYDAAMADLMANSPGAIAQLENIVNSQVGGTLGPDNIDVGGGWNHADATDYSMEVTASRPETTYPEASYSNEGRNYPGTATTTGSGGSPVNASTTTTTPSLNDVLNVVKAGTLVAGLTGAASAAGGSPSGFEIVPVPSDWKSPTYGQTGQWPALTPIDFGSRELLRGTQWEKYINPAQPVTPVPAPTGMNYGQLMNVLQGGQGGTLSLNDIISGIQSQYGQTNTGTVGQ